MIRLPVVFCFDRAGLVGEDGPTHHGAFDMAALRPVPNLTIASPMDEKELRRLMYTAQLPDMGPFVIRYPRGQGVCPEWRCPLEKIEVGTGRRIKEGDTLAIITIGPIGNTALEAINEWEQLPENQGKSIALYDLRFLKPLDEKLLHEVGRKFQHVVTIEDGCRNGGMGSAVMEWMSDQHYTCHIARLGLPDHFVEHGTVAQLQHIVGIDKEGISQAVNQELEAGR